MPIRSRPPYEGYCDECSWALEEWSYGNLSSAIRKHELDTGHDAAKSYRESVTPVATTSSYEYRARTTRSGRVISDSHGVDWYTEEGNLGPSSVSTGRETEQGISSDEVAGCGDTLN